LHVWALGRRSGKTTMAALVGLHSCLFRPDLDALVRAGERRYVIAVATRLEQARLFTHAARSVVRSSPLLRGMVASETDDEIVFGNGAVLASLPCSSRGVRGLAVSTVLMDEAAFFLDSEGNQAGEPMFQALVPGTAQFDDGSRVLVASTPNGEGGFFAELFQRAANGELEDARAEHRTSAEMNPTLSSSFLERELARDSEAFRGEYLAEFLGSGGAYLDPELIRDATADRGELPPDAATDWIAGFDPSFSHDPAALVLVGRALDDPHRLVVGAAHVWKPSRRPQTLEEGRAIENRLLDEAAAIAARYSARIVTDQYRAAGVVDYLTRHRLNVRSLALTATTKSAIFSEVRARLYERSLELLDDPTLLGDLRRLRARYAAGQSSVVTPRTGSSHCDAAVGLALAVHEHRGGPSSADGARLGGEFSSLMRDTGAFADEPIGYGEML
jgi:hypothetical protein